MVWVAAFFAGVSAAAWVWLIWRPWLGLSDSVVPIGGLRCLSPWVRALGPGCATLVSWRMRRRFTTLVQRAGLDGAWQVEHWLALRIVLAVLAAGAGVLVMSVWPDAGASGMLMGGLCAAVPGFWWPDYSLGRLGRIRRARMLRELPFMLDLMTLCVEAGLSLHGALEQAARHAPEGPLRDSLGQALSAMRAGVARPRALRQWADQCGVQALNGLVLALEQADQLGMNLGPLLRAQAAEQRSERFLRAEKLALEAPVKMLFPMVTCIFPCTFLIIAFPVAVKLFDAGF
ncbi:MAG: type II secretion system F family protein [Alcaligenaceae bacterium]|nr:type II secretion system F family protein [Alcaligenaceae bacterium]